MSLKGLQVLKYCKQILHLGPKEWSMVDTGRGLWTYQPLGHFENLAIKTWLVSWEFPWFLHYEAFPWLSKILRG